MHKLIDRRGLKVVDPDHRFGRVFCQRRQRLKANPNLAADKCGFRDTLLRRALVERRLEVFIDHDLKALRVS